MTTSEWIETTTPLFENGPSVDDLQADDGPWRIRRELIDYYLTAVGDGPSRQDINRHEENLDAGRKALLRDMARQDAGEPPLWSKDHAMMWPQRARDLGAITIDDERQLANPSTGWPYPEMVSLLAYSMHLDYREQAARQLKADTFREVLERQAIKCALCGDTAHGGGDICSTCRPIVAHARLLRTAEERIGKHTRLEHAMQYLEETS